MNPAQALHATARRYCNEHFSRWAARYTELPNAGRDTDGYNYTKEALDTFPRYNVLNAIRVELDRIDPTTLVDLEGTRALIVDAGKNAEDDFTRNPIGPIDAAAMTDEREAFCSYIRSLKDSDLNITLINADLLKINEGGNYEEMYSVVGVCSTGDLNRVLTSFLSEQN